MRRYKMLISIPFFAEGNIYAFNEESENVWRVDENNVLFEYPLRRELSEYLWLIRDDWMQEL